MSAVADAAAPAAVVDDARFAAEGTRTAARWVTTAFAAIPALAIVTALVKGPGEAGFDNKLLGWGLALGAVGALIGILAFARVFAPVHLNDTKDFGGFSPAKEIPGAPTELTTYHKLLQAIDRARDDVSAQEAAFGQAKAVSDTAEAVAKTAEDQALSLEKQADAVPDVKDARERAVKARGDATTARVSANAALGDANFAEADKSDAGRQLRRYFDLRKQAFGLKASDSVRERFLEARILSVAAVGLIATSVGLLAAAPKQKPEETTVTPSLVSVVLTPEGMERLGCRESPIRALRVGGDNTAPSLITLAQGRCPAKSVSFPTIGDEPWGSVTPVKLTKPAEAE